MPVPTFFRDPDVQQTFAQQGFVAFPFLGQEATEDLQELFDRIRPIQLTGIWSNVQDRSAEVNIEVAERIARHFAGPFSQHFVGCEIAGSTFLVKSCGEGTESNLHQDWNSVDESRSLSLNIWCPLVDVDADNGALQVLPGSHRQFPSVRGMTIPSTYLPFDDALEPHLCAVDVPAGWAVCYAHNLFHGSKPNRTDRVRVAAVAGVLPVEAPHVHYFRPRGSSGAAEVYAIDQSFYEVGQQSYRSGQRPAGFPLIATLDPVPTSPSQEDVIARYRAMAQRSDR